MDDVINIFESLDDLKSLRTKSEREAWLLKNKSNQDIVALFKFMFDDAIVTNVNRRRLAKPLRGDVSTDNYTIESFADFLAFLPNSSGTDRKVSIIRSYVERFEDPDIKNFLYDVAAKSLKLGINIKTLQSVYGREFIVTHDVQLGSPRDKLRLKPDEEFFLTQKLNGVRCTYVDGKLLSRQGKEFDGFPAIIDTLEQIQKFMPDNMVYDGELIRKNVDGLSDNENFRIGTGIINSQNTEDKFQIQLKLFDVLPLSEFRAGVSKDNYDKRSELLRQIYSYTHQYSHETGEFPFVDVVLPVYHGNDTAKIDEMLKIADNNGWEGLMLNKNAPYYCKRTTTLIKIKSFKEVDLPVIGYEEGDGKFKGILGSIVVDYHGTEVNVGSGFDDEQRAWFWVNKDDLIGKIATVKYKEVSQNKETGRFSLQFPVFVGLRIDKNTVSYN